AAADGDLLDVVLRLPVVVLRPDGAARPRRHGGPPGGVDEVGEEELFVTHGAAPGPTARTPSRARRRSGSPLHGRRGRRSRRRGPRSAGCASGSPGPWARPSAGRRPAASGCRGPWTATGGGADTGRCPSPYRSLLYRSLLYRSPLYRSPLYRF